MQLGLVMLDSFVQVVLRPHIRLPRPAVTHFQLQTPPPDPPAEEGTMSTRGNQGVPFVANGEGVGEVFWWLVGKGPFLGERDVHSQKLT